ncbi:MAG TPA: RsmD family RNA methyltransferase [Candidatus Krumholzibacteria bacterium]|nr:RsmD family RNA methyltransferase [Candidatus Krumholzibacteria bacterium]HPD71470.1 RsmD family RNA methyltransferase [Candidatus Krumholzibacteria bacterium]HRY41597.1 RsmD family RNA methyltransferase [Candidatus Krumholzibacteria bacterium]
MRITGGQWRGRRVEAAAGGVRPTTDRVREALFDLVGGAIDGAPVADLCCGSGALGLEALSRGAAVVDFVDVAPACLATVRANLELCGAPDDRWRLHRADAARWLARRLGEDGPPLVVLADPPYDGPAAAAVVRVLAAASPARILVAVLEHPATATPDLPREGGWTLRTRSYGRTALSLVRPARPESPEVDHA